MKSVILLDTGPLVALFCRRDQHHRWARGQIGQLPAPLLTCEPVLTEACFLLRRLIGNSDVVLEFVETGAAEVAFSLNDEVTAIRSLMARYSNVPMSLADACLVRMSELYPDCVLLTTDDDFAIYRRLGRKAIPTLTPSSPS
ncbi:MAG: type II toxin-antitoxin system VapC family toxin [Blastocatellales bacterium]